MKTTHSVQGKIDLKRFQLLTQKAYQNSQTCKHTKVPEKINVQLHVHNSFLKVPLS